MYIRLIVWTTVAMTVERSNAFEMFTAAELMSSKYYKVFTTTIDIYSTMNADDCKKSNGEFMHVSKTSNNIENFIDKYVSSPDVSFVEFICKLQGTVAIDRHIVYVLDNEPCHYYRKFCYTTNKNLIFWETSFDYVVLFEGSLDFWEMQLPEVSEKLRFLSHKTLNLTLIIRKNVMVQNRMYFSTHLNGVFVKGVSYVESTYLNESISGKYLGKIAENMKDNYLEMGQSGQQKGESFIKMELVSSDQYRMFYLTLPVYYASNNTEDCESTIFISPLIIPNLTTLPTRVNLEIKRSRYICKAASQKMYLDRNIILLKERPCRFDTGYCYTNNKNVVFWSTAIINTETYYKGIIDVWKIESSKLSLQLIILIDKHINDYGFRTAVMNMNKTTIWVTNFPVVYLQKLLQANTVEETITETKNYNFLIFCLLSTAAATYIVINLIALLSIFIYKNVLFS